VIGATIIKFPTAYAKTSEEYFQKAVDLLKKYRNHDYVNICLAPQAPYTLSEDQFERVAQLSEEYNVKVSCHIHETESEVAKTVDNYGVRPIEWLNRLGIINNRLIAVHCTQLTESEISLFASRGTSVVHCPESNCKLGSGICPVVDLARKGVNVCLGTDSAASNNEMDMFGEMKTATFLHKGITKNPKVLPAAEVLAMATINGAKAIGWENKIGSLEVGKYADLVAVDLDTLFTLPVYNPLSHIVYSVGRNNVSDVWIGGKRHVNNGHLLTYDEEKLLQLAKEWGKRISVSYKK